MLENIRVEKKEEEKKMINKKKSSRRRLTEDEFRQIVSLYHAGSICSEIARITGRSDSVIRRALKNLSGRNGTVKNTLPPKPQGQVTNAKIELAALIEIRRVELDALERALQILEVS
jgi:DNA-binding MarR family transcriptional regulator